MVGLASLAQPTPESEVNFEVRVLADGAISMVQGNLGWITINFECVLNYYANGKKC